MELIIIRGQENAGKTTTCAMLHNELITKNKAKVLFIDTPIEGISELIPIPNDGPVIDFVSVLSVGAKVITIISMGDKANVLKDIIEDYKHWKDPSFMVVCARSRRRKGSVMCMLMETYKDWYNQDNEIWTTWTKNYKQKTEVKKPVVSEIINRMGL